MAGLEFAYKETEAECDADRSDLWAMQLSMDSMQEGGGAIRMYRRGFEQAAQRAIEAKKSRRMKERVLNALVEYAERNKKADEAEREANKKRQERAMKKWVKVEEEERRRRNVVEENVKQKRVATSSFIQWYWQAFAHAIEEAEEVMLRGGTTHSSWRVEGLQLDEGAH
jgi:predicted ATPase with chaperone activity